MSDLKKLIKTIENYEKTEKLFYGEIINDLPFKIKYLLTYLDMKKSTFSMKKKYKKFNIKELKIIINLIIKKREHLKK